MPDTLNELNFMVVEDDDFQRKVVTEMLLSLGATMVCDASNGRQALDILRREKHKQIDIVICDLNMPEMDGMEFLRHLGEERQHVSIIITSSLDKKLIDSVGKMADMHDIHLLGKIEKPVTPSTLKVLISQYRSPENKRRQQIIAQTSPFTLYEILDGVRAKQIEPFYQPKLNIASGAVVGAEALARWIHPQHGVITPDAFIPQLEQSGNIDGLTFLMLEKAASACRMFHNKGFQISISVNLSLVSLDDTNLADRIMKVVKAAEADPEHIILEITESAAMTNVAHSLENLARLRMYGFGLSIDDYGTGYASMQQLTRIPFSELKIDRSFVKDVSDNEALRVVVEQSIQMARKLGVKTVAEGVENRQDWDVLKEIGCDTGQGFFIAKPMNLESFLDFLLWASMPGKDAPGPEQPGVS
ncbi:MAG: diguanylate phosphodiesterase [Zetaproteobacteria bacterium CG12_big_fil_rev_8_21_14_0_65_55_1124]|nr:MAG: diguanylate phosphodiesterase [Zetaproteobacteria bacterium CG1_02_55_237]PIS18806.1 MAG: diguanylate phosphodiesterase [Zetaproteobacteria bacterium CG08_land_8_20_14_0_20_55_17]PIW43922.1 MAG: diguanylate phosphodiesterase [Zetaproteobacteria bacterium CG12_big_fil_rev_8_21_14_0_65_55_1124]PIY54487.1 MAG: diguanylate phosphodiesterase [Zetaproteobacteria bacterium CG_4_10_14_0_8_um_filter_55_43]PIZ38241.1 MAG: diguanylate phosphodiesterase [Zetaproteobacteria bacterium CG_4_10_14_0_2_